MPVKNDGASPRSSKVFCYVEQDMHEWLNTEAQASGMSLSTFVAGLLSDQRRRIEEPETALLEQLAVHLDRVHRSIREMKDDHRFMEEMLAAYVRVYLNHAPLIPDHKIQETSRTGGERFDKFVRYLAKNFGKQSLLSELKDSIEEEATNDRSDTQA